MQATIESDPGDLIFGIEPVYAYGLATLSCVGLGWLAGPTVGGAVWRLTHRNVAKAMEAKDKGAFPSGGTFARRSSPLRGGVR